MNLSKEQIKILDDKTEYEKYVIANTIDVINKVITFDNNSSILYIDHEYSTHQIFIKTSYGEDKVRNFVDENLIPLLFITSYKMLDMIIETIIEINNLKVPNGFAEKSAVVDNLINSGKLLAPSIITDNDWRYIFALYNSFRHKRNIIVHRKGFKVENGDVIFDNKDIISKEKVYSFVACVYILMELLTGDNSEIYCEGLRNSLRKEINELISYLGNTFTRLPIKYILIHIIRYVINDKNDNRVILNRIRKSVKDEKSNWENSGKHNTYEVYYKLDIERCGEMWSIPSDAIKENVTEIDLNEYEKYKR